MHDNKLSKSLTLYDLVGLSFMLGNMQTLCDYNDAARHYKKYSIPLTN